MEDFLYVISNFLRIPEYFLTFPNFIFYALIPFIVVTYVLNDVLNRLRIFTVWGKVNVVISMLISFLLVSVLYPTFLVISVLYILFLKKITIGGLEFSKMALIAEIAIKLGFVLLIYFLYFYLLPHLSASFFL